MDILRGIECHRISSRGAASSAAEVSRVLGIRTCVIRLLSAGGGSVWRLLQKREGANLNRQASLLLLGQSDYNAASLSAVVGAWTDRNSEFLDCRPFSAPNSLEAFRFFRDPQRQCDDLKAVSLGVIIGWDVLSILLMWSLFAVHEIHQHHQYCMWNRLKLSIEVRVQS